MNDVIQLEHIERAELELRTVQRVSLLKDTPSRQATHSLLAH